jgi:hypothetical protein
VREDILKLLGIKKATVFKVRYPPHPRGQPARSMDPSRGVGHDLLPIPRNGARGREGWVEG